MSKHAWFRLILMVVLIAGLGVPPEVWPVFAQQEGPMSPPPAQQPEQPQAPTSAPGQSSQRQPPPPSSPQAVITVNSNLVDVDATVTDHDGDLVTGLKKENFRVYDDGQLQQISNFGPTDAPITVVILLEYSSTFWNYFAARGAYWADGFLQHLKPQDWVALKTFDLNTHLVQDFTQNKSEVDQDIQTLGFPTFHEEVLFDAVYQTLDQLRDVKGKKSILVIASGYDTFSKHNLDQILDRLKETEVTIFCVGMGEQANMYNMGPDIGYLQAKNQLTTFARMTGGYAFFPVFDAQMPDIFNTVAQFLRFQYTLGFTPTTPQDGKYHKVVVKIVDDQGDPMKLRNKKGKKQPVDVYARQGYMAPSASAAGN
ncbi:MAG TPA: VWA domain-containing protein [Candidatus Dormibacteraeota bacterium]|nr:VWA domain-containing protein [Candidatus Dormibacteraeota bacterium]